MQKRILFVNIGGNINDRRTWSGIPYSLFNELNKTYLVEEYSIDLSKTVTDKIFIAYRRYIKHHSCKWQFTERYARMIAKKIINKVNSSRPDVIFAIGSAGIAYLETDIPIIYFSDAVFSSMINYYYFGLRTEEIEEYNHIQDMALQKASTIILTSKWAKNAAVKDYNVSPSKVKIYHLGSNIEGQIEQPIAHKEINLLFIGADLKRKGADIAIQTVKLCNEIDKNHRYMLHIVGGMVEKSKINSFVKSYGFINRNDAEQRKLMNEILSKSDIFILPTKAECAGIVFCEASQCGIPSISYKTGGVEDYIIDGKTGFLIDIQQAAEEFANKIIYMANNPQVLLDMKNNAKKQYIVELNWEHLGVCISNEINRLIRKNKK